MRCFQEELNEAVATMTGVFILDGCQGQCDQCAQVHGLVAWKSAHGGPTGSAAVTSWLIS